MRNAVYSGPWVSDAKRYFSKNGFPAYGLGGDYMNGTPIRQEYLETVIDWISGGDIEEYMGQHQHDEDANAAVGLLPEGDRVGESTFPKYRKPMKGIAWGALYNQFKDAKLDREAGEAQSSELMTDEDVPQNNGHLPVRPGRRREAPEHLRVLPTQRLAAYERQKGICPFARSTTSCADARRPRHPLGKGGKTVPENCQMLCTADNIKKSNL